MEVKAAATGPIRSHEDIEAFQRAMKLVKPVHEVVKRFPKYEDNDLVQQMRRASKSIPANIAEGFSKRRSAKDFKLYLAHALGSVNEMIVHLKISQELGYLPAEEARELIDEYNIVGKQINKLTQVWR